MIGRLKTLVRNVLSLFSVRTDMRKGFKAIGSNVVLGENIKCIYKNRIEIGTHVYMGGDSLLDGRGGIVIEDYSIISSDVTILSSQHNYKNAHLLPYDEVELLDPVVIGKYCWIGIRCIILPGVQLGDGCVVGAGSVVTKSFPAGTIVAGNPAKMVSRRDMKHALKLADEGNYYMLHKQQGIIQKVEEARSDQSK
jgi:acetyltransferase-like isoleucine patch superfamily enzyme